MHFMHNFMSLKFLMMKNKSVSRRDFLATAGKAGMIAGFSGHALGAMAQHGTVPHAEVGPASIPYRQEPLPYAFSALEPSIDARTMEIHFTKHAAGYAKNLAEAVEAERVDTSKIKLEELLAGVSKYSAKMRNNAGGHYNHSLFWQLMTSPGKTVLPSAGLAAAIQRDFGSLEAMKTKFDDAGKTRFGSGWAWLILNAGKKLQIVSMPNQDNPLMDLSEVKGIPLFGLDVWEHAYYLKYQNRRADYIAAWWNVLNWDFVNKRFASLTI
jgi:Fe-Mn family superoxide dismutase